MPEGRHCNDFNIPNEMKIILQCFFKQFADTKRSMMVCERDILIEQIVQTRQTHVYYHFIIIYYYCQLITGVGKAVEILLENGANPNTTCKTENMSAIQQAFFEFFCH